MLAALNLWAYVTLWINQTTPMLTAGTLAPAFRSRDGQGQPVSLADLPGPVALTFIAPYNAASTQELDLWAATPARYPGVHFRFVVQASDLADFYEYLLLNQPLTPEMFALIVDERGDLQRAYRVRGFPTTYFLDTDHRVRAYRLGGPLTATQLDVYLGRLNLIPLDATPTGVVLPPLLQP